MAEYIDKYAFVAWLEKQKRLSKLHTIMMLEQTPAADVAPVRHGRWLLDGRCSECLENPLTTHRTYCPNCGVKMDLEVSE